MAAKIKNTYFEAELFRQRAVVAMLAVAVIMASLLFGYFNLQVLRFDEYREQADSNRVRLKPTMPARGLIYDRNGRLLTDNVSAYRLELTPFGGIKDSGLGYKEGVQEAMKSFTNIKTYSIPWS